MTMKRLTEIPVIVDLEQSPAELRVHPALFDAIQAAFIEADGLRGLRPPSGDIEDGFIRENYND